MQTAAAPHSRNDETVIQTHQQSWIPWVLGVVGLRLDRLLTGHDLLALNDEALCHVAERTDVFVEVDPNQKERIILALKKMGHVFGFLGDGVNDAPAMHAADTSLSVDDAVDVAREAADFVRLERDLDVIRQGIEEGRRTFANTLTYEYDDEFQPFVASCRKTRIRGVVGSRV